MEQLIKFRMQASTLRLNEYRSLLCNVLNETNMEEFSCMIFNHFTHRKRNKQNKRQSLNIDAINDEISNIIHQRDDSEEDEQPINLDHLTSALVQEIASFLPFKSYSKFQCCCRAIFYATNSPSTLYELDGTIDIGKCINAANAQNERQIQAFMKRFEGVQKLEITRMNEKYISCIRFRNLKELKLYAMYGEEVKPYLSKNTFKFNWNEIRVLIVRGNFKFALQIIKQCINLVVLHVGDVYDNQYNTFSRQLAGLECLSNLQGLTLSVENGIDARIVLKNICNTLQSLNVYLGTQNIDGMTFHNLVELTLPNPIPSQIISIIRTTKHLKRLKLDDVEGGYFENNLVFRKIFELNKLEYLRIECRGGCLLPLIRLIETAFNKKGHSLTVELRIQLYFYLHTGNEEERCQSMTIHRAIVSLCHILCTWYANGFTLIIGFDAPFYSIDNKESNAFNQWLEDISNTFSVHKIKLKERVIISNNQYQK
eukprot:179420_1